MIIRLGEVLRALLVILALGAVPIAGAFARASWHGVLRDEAGKPVAAAHIELTSKGGDHRYTNITSKDGDFVLSEMVAGEYELSVESGGRIWKSFTPILVVDGIPSTGSLQFSSRTAEVRVVPASEEASAQASGGERLSSGEVSSLPLNARDFSKLLLLAAGTMTDANGAANFTQQFAVNGQRGVTTIFAMDGFDTTDPEMGGATFSNFNVDAIEEVQSSSGVMQAEIGHGGASYTNVVTKSGVNQI